MINIENELKSFEGKFTKVKLSITQDSQSNLRIGFQTLLIKQFSDIL